MANAEVDFGKILSVQLDFLKFWVYSVVVECMGRG